METVKAWPPGAVLLTRNLYERDNTTPGYWNHAAIVGGANVIIEAQADPGAIITTDLDVFFERYPRIVMLQCRWTVAQALAADHAVKFLGMPYRKYASIFRFLRKPTRGENCVSLVRRAYKEALGKDPKWKKPDHIYYDAMFNVIAEKQ